MSAPQAVLAMPLALEAATAAALSEDLRLVVRLHEREPDAALIEALRSAAPEDWFALRLDDETFASARTLLLEGLAGAPQQSDTGDLDELAAEFAAIYYTHGYRAAPSESVWRDEDGLERQAAMFAVRDWFRRHNVKVSDWRTRSEDHIVNELTFLAQLVEGAHDPGIAREAALFLRAHPLAWVPEFAGRVASRCRLALFAGFELLTVAYLQRLAVVLGAVTGLDMTPAALTSPRVGGQKAGSPAPTCGDPPATPASGPGW